jgi:hypothetical protein
MVFAYCLVRELIKMAGPGVSGTAPAWLFLQWSVTIPARSEDEQQAASA